MKKILFLLLAVIIIAVVTPLSFNNSQEVTFSYVFGSYTLPLSWLVFGAFIAGVIVALPFFALTGWGWKMRAKGLSKQVDTLIVQRKRDEIAQQFKEENA